MNVIADVSNERVLVSLTTTEAMAVSERVGKYEHSHRDFAFYLESAALQIMNARIEEAWKED